MNKVVTCGRFGGHPRSKVYCGVEGLLWFYVATWTPCLYRWASAFTHQWTDVWFSVKLPAETVEGKANPRFIVPLLSRQHDGCLYVSDGHRATLITSTAPPIATITIKKSEKKLLIKVSHICTNVLQTYFCLLQMPKYWNLSQFGDNLVWRQTASECSSWAEA